VRFLLLAVALTGCVAPRVHTFEGIGFRYIETTGSNVRQNFGPKTAAGFSVDPGGLPEVWVKFDGDKYDLLHELFHLDSYLRAEAAGEDWDGDLDHEIMPEKWRGGK